MRSGLFSKPEYIVTSITSDDSDICMIYTNSHFIMRGMKQFLRHFWLIRKFQVLS
ncbi:hypothetical protein BBC0178_002790 [Bartonella apihabitans]|uniref:Uncharacterized protein n=1 Tax=Bartonella apihabitans TaxID=2750929 RepID=A0A1U9M8Y5_9HYPH|nr:hypothetical protein BBC0178_002790 [Bartonella apihabitans]